MLRQDSSFSVDGTKTVREPSPDRPPTPLSMDGGRSIWTIVRRRPLQQNVSVNLLEGSKSGSYSMRYRAFTVKAEEGANAPEGFKRKFVIPLSQPAASSVGT